MKPMVCTYSDANSGSMNYDLIRSAEIAHHDGVYKIPKPVTKRMARLVTVSPHPPYFIAQLNRRNLTCFLNLKF
jgi:hypothetical protein